MTLQLCDTTGIRLEHTRWARSLRDEIHITLRELGACDYHTIHGMRCSWLSSRAGHAELAHLRLKHIFEALTCRFVLNGKKLSKAEDVTCESVRTSTLDSALPDVTWQRASLSAHWKSCWGCKSWDSTIADNDCRPATRCAAGPAAWQSNLL
jgi:hypothetical protein